MKRDMDLVRDIMLQLAESDGEVDAGTFVGDGRDLRLFAYHFQIMEEAGLIEANLQRTFGGGYVLAQAFRLTWEGNDFMASVSSGKVWEWLRTGRKPKVTFKSEQVRKRVFKNPHELRTAERVSEHEIEPFIIKDYVWVKRDGRKFKVGLPDFRIGVEIKTPMESENPYGAIANYLNNSRKKRGLKRVLIDNTESKFSDEDFIKAVKEEIEYYAEIPS